MARPGFKNGIPRSTNQGDQAKSVKALNPSKLWKKRARKLSPVTFLKYPSSLRWISCYFPKRNRHLDHPTFRVARQADVQGFCSAWNLTRGSVGWCGRYEWNGHRILQWHRAGKIRECPRTRRPHARAYRANVPGLACSRAAILFRARHQGADVRAGHFSDNSTYHS